MSETELFDLKVTNLIKHDPIRYTVRRGVLVWFIEDPQGNKVETFIFKFRADVTCSMLNAIYSLGYSTGVQASLQTFFQ